MKKTCSLNVDYKEFTGSNLEQMPLLMAEGRVPMSTAGLMQIRLGALTDSEEVKNFWWNNHFETGDAFIRHPDGRVKFVFDAQPLRGLTLNSGLTYGGLTLKSGVYEQLDGQEFSRRELQRYALPKTLSEWQVESNPIWNTLAREPNLLNAYGEAVFDQAKREFDYDSNMGVYLGGGDLALKNNQPIMRPLMVNGLAARGSSLFVFPRLDHLEGRLIGLTLEPKK